WSWGGTAGCVDGWFGTDWFGFGSSCTGGFGPGLGALAAGLVILSETLIGKGTGFCSVAGFMVELAVDFVLISVLPDFAIPAPPLLPAVTAASWTDAALAPLSAGFGLIPPS